MDGWLSVYSIYQVFTLNQVDVSIFYKIKFESVIPNQWFNFFQIIGKLGKIPIIKKNYKIKKLAKNYLSGFVWKQSTIGFPTKPDKLSSWAIKPDKIFFVKFLFF